MIRQRDDPPSTRRWGAPPEVRECDGSLHFSWFQGWLSDRRPTLRSRLPLNPLNPRLRKSALRRHRHRPQIHHRTRPVSPPQPLPRLLRRLPPPPSGLKVGTKRKRPTPTWSRQDREFLCSSNKPSPLRMRETVTRSTQKPLFHLWSTSTFWCRQERTFRAKSRT